MNTNIHIYIYIHTYISMFVIMLFFLWTYAPLSMYMSMCSVCMYKYICVYIYVHTYILYQGGISLERPPSPEPSMSCSPQFVASYRKMRAPKARGRLSSVVPCKGAAEHTAPPTSGKNLHKPPSSMGVETQGTRLNHIATLCDTCLIPWLLQSAVHLAIPLMRRFRTPRGPLAQNRPFLSGWWPVI